MASSTATNTNEKSSDETTSEKNLGMTTSASASSTTGTSQFPSNPTATINTTTKKKARYSRQQKREHKSRLEEQAVHATTGHHDFPSSSHLHKPRKPRPPTNQPTKAVLSSLTWQDRVFRCIREAESTQSIIIEGNGPPPPMPFVDSNNNTTDTINNNESPSPFLDSIRLVTSSSIQSSLLAAPPAPGLTIRVKPLLILDLNGILCHRRRLAKEPPGLQLQLRPSQGKVAGTPIILRHHLSAFLQLLHPHFCLAIWTSAKAKTARDLLQLLLPIEIQKQLLFVWAQHHCDAIRLPGDTLFQKDLAKVWRAYPLWNANNTLLMDDSPEKCPFAPANAIHPPPLHGQWTPPTPFGTPIDATTHTHPQAQPQEPWMSDEYNEAMQFQFFQQYIQHWHNLPFVQELTKETVPTYNDNDDGAGTPRLLEQMNNGALYNFLWHHGTGHMGWRGSHLQHPNPTPPPSTLDNDPGQQVQEGLKPSSYYPPGMGQ